MILNLFKDKVELELMVSGVTFGISNYMKCDHIAFYIFSEKAEECNYQKYLIRSP